jgi:putative hemolysin
MRPIDRGKYRARFAETRAETAAALALRARVFRGGEAGDEDAFDPRCAHALIEERARGELVAAFRLLRLSGGAEIGQSYSAQFYGLSALADYPGPIAEMGRFCLAPGAKDPDILRLAWVMLAGLVDAEGITFLFGCSSFAGTDALAHSDAFALLAARHLAPQRWRPAVKAPEVCALAGDPRPPDPRRAMLAMPPLLKGYLALGGWVSAHAVIDRDLGTMHVFTGLEIANIPAARAKVLRAS